ncbi:MAG: cardiolipin synthase [Bacteroidales bacterium]
MDISASFILSVLYVAVVTVIGIKIIIDSSTPSKALGYLLLVILIPILGVFFYLLVGLNYRKKKLYNKKIEINKQTFPELDSKISSHTTEALSKHLSEHQDFFPLSKFLETRDLYLFSSKNSIELLVNGEQKVPELKRALIAAKHHIHMEYYIYENDEVGNEIAEILIAKAKEGVKVRFIYDDYGSKNIRKNIVKRLLAAGVEAYPFYKINLIWFANRINYRNHRKIVVVDGTTGFIGGINISDKYINKEDSKLFWRDTHIKIIGAATLSLQYTFLTDWNFCAQQNIEFSTDYFPLENLNKVFGEHSAQIVSSGPDSDYPDIMYSMVQLIMLAKKEINITTPYFIPDKSFIDALKIASLSGVKVKVLVPGISDSLTVNLASQSHYQELLEAGIQIYRYKRGFVHSKTLVCDGNVSMVGTANLDIRSFDLNFETNAIVYGAVLAKGLLTEFDNDLKDSEQIALSEWKNRGALIKLAEKGLQLFSALM